MTTLRTISTPFRFDNTGRIATTTDRHEIAKNQILDVVATGAFERVMRPAYGANLQSVIFDPLNDVNLSEARNVLVAAVAKSVFVGTIVDVQFTQDLMAPTTLNVTIRYTTPPDTTIQSVTTTLTGLVTQETVL